MARMPEAEWQGEHAPIQSDGKRRAMARYDIVCVHTIVGFAPAHAAHFSVKRDGTILQSRDTDFQSGANLYGNHRVIAIENEDHGDPFPDWNVNDGHAVPGFTPEQIEANALILAWAHERHGVPLQLCPNSKSDSKGLAYHRQGIDGNFSGYRHDGRVDGGEVWSEHFGKVCPGDRRIDALPTILHRAKEIAEGVTEMQLGDKLFPSKENSPTVREALSAALQVKKALAEFRQTERKRDIASAEREKRMLAVLDGADLPAAQKTALKAALKEALREGTGP